MRKPKSLIDDDGEVRELTEEDFKLFRPIEEVLSPALVAMIGRGRGGRKDADQAAAHDDPPFA